MKNYSGQREHCWLIEDLQEKRGLIADIRSAFNVRMCATVKHDVIFYDSFPWQLWFCGYVVYRERDRLYLQKYSRRNFGEILAEVDVQGETPRFYWEYAGKLGKLLKPRLKLHALLEKTRYIRSGTVIEIKNRNEKTVSRLIINQYRHDERGKYFLQTVTAQPVRGYEKEFSSLNKILRRHKLKKSVVSSLHVNFELGDCWPEFYSSKPLYRPHGTRTTQEEILESVVDSWQNARKCEFGIVEDYDTEFLHDYRVCLRSIRSILRRIKGALSLEVQSQLAEIFADLGEKTNRLRDLDVYLLKEDKYKAMVPDHLSSTLEDMFNEYRKQRKSELRKISRYFDSKTYSNQIAKIETLIERGRGENPTKTGRRPITEVAHQRLKKQYRKVINLGRELHYKTSDASIHQLRLECKKLRYLLEYFAPMFKKKVHVNMLSSMKDLQDTLGIFNDLSVQQGSLQKYYAASESNNPLLGVAIGVLIGSMFEDQKHMRNKVIKMFDTFDSPGTHVRFRKMLKGLVRKL